MNNAALHDAFGGRRVLILGGLGFIGSSLAVRLAACGAILTLADAMIDEYGGNLRNIAPIRRDVVVNFCDIRDAAAKHQRSNRLPFSPQQLERVARAVAQNIDNRGLQTRGNIGDEMQSAARPIVRGQVSRSSGATTSPGFSLPSPCKVHSGMANPSRPRRG